MKISNTEDIDLLTSFWEFILSLMIFEVKNIFDRFNFYCLILRHQESYFVS